MDHFSSLESADNNTDMLQRSFKVQVQRQEAFAVSLLGLVVAVRITTPLQTIARKHLYARVP